jgi:predicted aldo/keto reductase-like oxidoreductase
MRSRPPSAGRGAFRMMRVMRYRTLGDSGLLVSVVGLGCNNFGGRLDVNATRAVVDAAIDVGVTLFDTSDTYGKEGGSELALGEVLAGRTPFISAQNHWSLLERGAEA